MFEVQICQYIKIFKKFKSGFFPGLGWYKSKCLLTLNKMFLLTNKTLRVFLHKLTTIPHVHVIDSFALIRKEPIS